MNVTISTHICNLLRMAIWPRVAGNTAGDRRRAAGDLCQVSVGPTASSRRPNHQLMNVTVSTCIYNLLRMAIWPRVANNIIETDYQRRAAGDLCQVSVGPTASSRRPNHQLMNVTVSTRIRNLLRMAIWPRVANNSATSGCWRGTGDLCQVSVGPTASSRQPNHQLMNVTISTRIRNLLRMAIWPRVAGNSGKCYWRGTGDLCQVSVGPTASSRQPNHQLMNVTISTHIRNLLRMAIWPRVAGNTAGDRR